MLIRSTVLLAALAAVAEAHIALWHPSMFGLLGNNPSKPANKETEMDQRNMEAVQPLKENEYRTVDQWFAHGRQKFPPQPGVFMELPAGGEFVGELHCDRAYTSMGPPTYRAQQAKQVYACNDPVPAPDGRQSAFHNQQVAGKPINLALFGGTALAIAYESDINKVKPSDFTVFSVNATSPWWRKTIYRIPAAMPVCPAAGCLCSWNWIHRWKNTGYGNEIYNNVYRCKITGAASKVNKLKLGGGQVPKKCGGSFGACVKGPKQPMYLFQKTGNNMVYNAAWGENPSYTTDWGFTDGRQQDLFTTNKKRLAADDGEDTDAAAEAGSEKVE